MAKGIKKSFHSVTADENPRSLARISLESQCLILDSTLVQRGK